eukprot:NODE_26_length_40862_cov_0.679513.p27 type:complete len:133 gc:universal NODE_26_length_40862_cov_0.679513:30630-30232(-)
MNLVSVAIVKVDSIARIAIPQSVATRDFRKTERNYPETPDLQICHKRDHILKILDIPRLFLLEMTLEHFEIHILLLNQGLILGLLENFKLVIREMILAIKILVTEKMGEQIHELSENSLVQMILEIESPSFP